MLPPLCQPTDSRVLIFQGDWGNRQDAANGVTTPMLNEFTEKSVVHEGSGRRKQKAAQPPEAPAAELAQQKTPGTIIVRGVFAITAVPANPYISAGMGVEDVAVASRIYRLAKERGVGTPLCFWED